MEVREFTTLEEMTKHLDVMQHLYPELSLERYEEMLTSMLPHNYGQIGVFEGETCIAISGYWTGTKLWCGKYIELDNVVVHAAHRSKGAGKLMSDYLEEKAKALNCSILTLDAYSNNFKAHRFYYNQGFAPRGFHFIKILDKSGLT